MYPRVRHKKAEAHVYAHVSIYVYTHIHKSPDGITSKATVTADTNRPILAARLLYRACSAYWHHNEFRFSCFLTFDFTISVSVVTCADSPYVMTICIVLSNLFVCGSFLFLAPADAVLVAACLSFVPWR